MPHSTGKTDRINHKRPISKDQIAEKIIGVLAKISGEDQSDSTGLIDIASAQVAGISYSNIGEAGLEFLEEWAASGAKVRVPAFMNPCAMDTRRWRELGIDPKYAAKQQRIITALKKMGVKPSLTCTPYFGHFTPEREQHIAWSESSAVSCANSIFGAMTNREGGPSALAAAICGKTVMGGYHLPENRRPTHIVQMSQAPRDAYEFGALGLYVGRQVQDGIPFFIFPDNAPAPDLKNDIAAYKALAAAMAASGAVALFHIRGITPEAEQMEEHLGGLPQIRIDSIQGIRESSMDAAGAVDVVSLGCPHASIDEIREIARKFEGREVKTKFWICASRKVCNIAAAEGLKDIIEKSGALLLCDMCVVVAPLAELGVKSVATNSAKTAFYMRSRPGISVGFGDIEDCVKAGLTGKWRSDHHEKQPETDSTNGQTTPRPRIEKNRNTDRLHGRTIVGGKAEGIALCSRESIGFFGNIDPKTGVITEPGHELEGQSVAGKILAFPRGKGSTVGSYVIYSLKKAGMAPLAIINDKMEPIVAAGAAIAEIPAVDMVDTSTINSGDIIEVNDGEIRIA